MRDRGPKTRHHPFDLPLFLSNVAYSLIAQFTTRVPAQPASKKRQPYLFFFVTTLIVLTAGTNCSVNHLLLSASLFRVNLTSAYQQQQPASPLPAPLPKDWWESSPKRRVGWFNSSVIYLKPHKTGSESFKRILARVAGYYNLTHDAELESLLATTTDPSKRDALLRRRYDMLVRHSVYRANETEQRLRGWPDGRDGHPARRILRVVTIRDPLDRLLSHYVSMRRFGRFVPRRGNFSSGTLTEDDEIEDFREWLHRYAFSHETRYLANREAVRATGYKRGAAGALVDHVVGLYDHVIVAEQWRTSLCLFGFTEGIKPELLRSRRRNWARAGEKRFDHRRVLLMSRPDIWSEVMNKIEYDWVLYTALLKKFSYRLETTASEKIWRYCGRVGQSQLGGGTREKKEVRATADTLTRQKGNHQAGTSLDPRPDAHNISAPQADASGHTQRHANHSGTTSNT